MFWKKDKTTPMVTGLVGLLIAALLIFTIFFLIYYLSSLQPKKQLSINGYKINIEIVATKDKMVKGLSDRKSLGENDGMLFVYDTYNIPTFWMKDMFFPIDIIWINDDMIVGFEQEVSPVATGAVLPRYSPKTYINYVLEVNSGFVRKYNILIGDTVKIPI